MRWANLFISVALMMIGHAAMKHHAPHLGVWQTIAIYTPFLLAGMIRILK